MWSRIRALIVKELLAVLRDPRARVILIGPPIAQLLVFAYAATLEVKNVDIAVWDRDSGYWSEELVHRIAGAPTFRSITRVGTSAELARLINREDVLAAIEIGPDFSREIEAGRPAQVQVILDGRRSNAAQIVGGYFTEIVRQLSADASQPGHGPPATIVPRNWFNPNLDFIWFMVPNLIAVIALLIGLIVTALSVARERELGTFDQLMVSPLRTHEILIGKLVPPLMIGLGHVTIYVLAALFVFDVPLRGSLLLLYVSGVFYLAALVGLGLFISSLSATQQQAILGAFLVMVPTTLLSGFATPIDNMPAWLRPLTFADPLRYFLVIVRGVFLKALPAEEILANTLPLILIALVTLTASAWLFRKRME